MRLLILIYRYLITIGGESFQRQQKAPDMLVAPEIIQKHVKNSMMRFMIWWILNSYIICQIYVQVTFKRYGFMLIISVGFSDLYQKILIERTNKCVLRICVRYKKIRFRKE